MTWVNNTKYLGVMQSDLKFNQHMTSIKRKAYKTLGSIKHLLHDAPRKARLLADTSLCRPLLEYAHTVWDPSRGKDVESIEMTQHRAVRFINCPRGRESITEACSQLGLQTLQQRRRDHRISLLMKILQNEERHNNLALAYDELSVDRQGMSMTTRSATRGEPTSVHATTQIYHNSFLPRTIRDTRGNTQ